MKRSSNEAKWLDMIRRCKASGLPVKDWCAKNDVTVSSYKYWNARLRKSEDEKVEWAEVMAPVPEGKPGTEPVNTQRQASFTVRLKDFSIKVDKGFDGGTLAELLTVLRSVC